MRFGILTISSNRPGEDPAAALQRWVDVAVEAEQLGYWSIWNTEHHFASDPAYRPFGVDEAEYPPTDYDMSPDALTLLTYAAAKTSRIRLGTGVSVLHWDHPIKLAERAAMLDLLSGGRLELGIGRGLGLREQAVFDVPRDPDDNRRRFEECLTVIQKAWTGEPFTHEGEFFSYPEVQMTPNPGRTAPIFVGSGSMDSAAFAAEHDLPYATIVWPLLSIEAYREKVEHYRASADAAGVDVSGHALPHFLYMHCAETDEEAAEVAFEHMKQLQYILEQHYELKRPGQQIDAARLKRLGHTGDTDDLETVAKLARFPVEQHLVGSPETIRERIRLLKDELGLDYVVAISGFGNMAPELSRPSMRLYAEQVIPSFDASPAPA